MCSISSNCALVLLWLPKNIHQIVEPCSFIPMVCLSTILAVVSNFFFFCRLQHATTRETPSAAPSPRNSHFSSFIWICVWWVCRTFLGTTIQHLASLPSQCIAPPVFLLVHTLRHLSLPSPSSDEDTNKLAMPLTAICCVILVLLNLVYFNYEWELLSFVVLLVLHVHDSKNVYSLYYNKYIDIAFFNP